MTSSPTRPDMEGLEAAPPDSGTGSVCSDYTEDGEVAEAAVKRRIQPDDLAISKLLNFNEEEDEDELTDSDDNDVEDEVIVQEDEGSSPFENFVSLCPSSLSGSVPSLLRRHSLAGAGTAPASLAEVGAGHTRQAVEPVVNLRLGELQHIRSVLGKAKLESLPIPDGVREAAEQSRVCALCLKTRFWLLQVVFSAAQCSTVLHCTGRGEVLAVLPDGVQQLRQQGDRLHPHRGLLQPGGVRGGDWGAGQPARPARPPAGPALESPPGQEGGPALGLHRLPALPCPGGAQQVHREHPARRAAARGQILTRQPL